MLKFKADGSLIHQKLQENLTKDYLLSVSALLNIFWHSRKHFWNLDAISIVWIKKEKSTIKRKILMDLYIHHKMN